MPNVRLTEHSPSAEKVYFANESLDQVWNEFLTLPLKHRDVLIYSAETLTETTINGHKALIEQNEICGQIFIVTEHYFYAVASTYSIDMDILWSAANQIKLP